MQMLSMNQANLKTFKQLQWSRLSMILNGFIRLMSLFRWILRELGRPTTEGKK